MNQDDMSTDQQVALNAFVALKGMTSHYIFTLGFAIACHGNGIDLVKLALFIKLGTG